MRREGILLLIFLISATAVFMAGDDISGLKLVGRIGGWSFLLSRD